MTWPTVIRTGRQLLHRHHRRTVIIIQILIIIIKLLFDLLVTVGIRPKADEQLQK